MKAPLGLLLAVVLLTGCAAKTGDSGDLARPATVPEASGPSAAPPASAVATGPARIAEPAISIPPKAPKTTKVEPPIDDFQQVTAQGRVRVTGPCVELVTDGLTWTLIGPEAARVRDGQQARATGVPDPSRETACTGSPLLVSRVTPM
ncbi:hypothetical protein [Dactylosporangium sp. NPDC048998]|uniref:hypothetical protein n=1 Tax=Dactylosporangium sp. NPDC048998 TaxID=3363976 RepID=UPI0037224E3D